VKIKYGKKIIQAASQPLIPQSIQLPIQPHIPNIQAFPVQNKISNQQPLAAPFNQNIETGSGHLQQQMPFQQAPFSNTNRPYPYSHLFTPQTPAFQLHPQLLVYPTPNPSFPMQQMYAIPHLYVKFPDNIELRKKIDEISMTVFKVFFLKMIFIL